MSHLAGSGPPFAVSGIGPVNGDYVGNGGAVLGANGYVDKSRIYVQHDLVAGYAPRGGTAVDGDSGQRASRCGGDRHEGDAVGDVYLVVEGVGLVVEAAAGEL